MYIRILYLVLLSPIVIFIIILSSFIGIIAGWISLIILSVFLMPNIIIYTISDNKDVTYFQLLWWLLHSPITAPIHVWIVYVKTGKLNLMGNQ